jgi:hypothetical protein
VRIVTRETHDRRPGRISAERLVSKLGWRAQKSVEVAVRELCLAFQERKLPLSLGCENYYNAKTLAEAVLV